MTIEEVNGKLSKLNEELRVACGNSTLGDELFDKIVNAKGMLDIMSQEVNFGKKEKEYVGNTFKLIRTDLGIIYHEFGGYTVFCRDSNYCLYSVLESLMDRMESNGDDNTTEDSKELLTLLNDAVVYCLSVPKIVFSDADLTLEIATRVLKYINDSMTEAVEKELAEEDNEANKSFYKATMQIEDLKKGVQKKG